jgi:hypothetical protein
MILAAFGAMLGGVAAGRYIDKRNSRDELGEDEKES